MEQTQWTDKEIRQATDDRLSFDEYCQVLTAIALSADTPLTVGVFGPWGSGKTSLLRLVQEALQQEQSQPPAATPGQPAGAVVDIRESQHISLTVEPTPPPKPAEPTLLDKYRQRRPLQRLLSAGQDFFAELPLAEVSLYLYLTTTTEERRSGSEAEDTVARRLEQLLSNDPTKVSSAVAAIQADETGKPGAIADFQRRLLGVIDQPDPATAITQRLSAGLALALLGDPRDFDERIAIPPGQYPLGPNREMVAIEGFKIGKYPVTNAQYGEFLKANDGVPPPDHWDGRICPPALANQPVTRVSWAEAQAYCRWAGKFLPTAQQWGAAAFDKNAGPPATTGNPAVPRLDSPTPVGLFPEAGSPLKVLDMIGNVWEWTQTAAGSDYSIRGGSWKDLPKIESTAGPETKHPLLGFRVAE
jgi:energy-coupling factor transporter ATP-binding protein EcfA2